MGALPDGTYHPHQVRVGQIGTGGWLGLQVRACPPQDEPWTVMSCGIEVGVDLVEAINGQLRSLGLRLEGGLRGEVEPFGPPLPGLGQLHELVLVGDTTEV